MRIVIALLIMVGTAQAAGWSATYALEGFTTDSKYVYFTRTRTYIREIDKRVSVYDASTTKRKRVVVSFHDCGGECDEEDPGLTREEGGRVVAKLHASYAKPDPKTLATSKAAIDRSVAEAAVATGLDQEFSAPNATVKTTSKLVGKLEDPSSEPGRAKFDIAITVTANGATYTGKVRALVQPVDKGDRQHWPMLAVEELAVAPDLRAVAIVFGREPYVSKLVKQ